MQKASPKRWFCHFFDLLESEYEKHRYKADRIWNVETGLNLVHFKVPQVICLKGKRQIGALTAAEHHAAIGNAPTDVMMPQTPGSSLISVTPQRQSTPSLTPTTPTSSSHPGCSGGASSVSPRDIVPIIQPKKKRSNRGRKPSFSNLITCSTYKTNLEASMAKPTDTKPPNRGKKFESWKGTWKRSNIDFCAKRSAFNFQCQEANKRQNTRGKATTHQQQFNSMTILLSSTSEDSQEYTPDHETSRKCREDVTQPKDLSSSNINFKLEFMSAVGLVTREALSELQNRRVERKKRSTANHMQFVYGDSWDLCQKRKKSNYLATGVSKSNSEVKRSSPAAIDIKRLSPPTKETQTQQASSSVHIPGLPSSLIIERLSSNQPLCKICRKTDNVKVCTNCVNSYHESCAKDSEGSCPECYSRSQEEIVHSYSDEKTSLTISGEETCLYVHKVNG
uniref:Uncharacterized protein n=1 Tax=Timema shepardi TaxID=629360 RepID=A0A7R9B4J4_TIMSH|nr:unnamed protein product [Timema shepardi]